MPTWFAYLFLVAAFLMGIMLAFMSGKEGYGFLRSWKRDQIGSEETREFWQTIVPLFAESVILVLGAIGAFYYRGIAL